MNDQKQPYFNPQDSLLHYAAHPPLAHKPTCDKKPLLPFRVHWTPFKILIFKKQQTPSHTHIQCVTQNSEAVTDPSGFLLATEMMGTRVVSTVGSHMGSPPVPNLPLRAAPHRATGSPHPQCLSPGNCHLEDQSPVTVQIPTLVSDKRKKPGFQTPVRNWDFHPLQYWVAACFLSERWGSGGGVIKIVCI